MWHNDDAVVWYVLIETTQLSTCSKCNDWSQRTTGVHKNSKTRTLCPGFSIGFCWVPSHCGRYVLAQGVSLANNMRCYWKTKTKNPLCFVDANHVNESGTGQKMCGLITCHVLLPKLWCSGQELLGTTSCTLILDIFWNKTVCINWQLSLQLSYPLLLILLLYSYCRLLSKMFRLSFSTFFCFFLLVLLLVLVIVINLFVFLLLVCFFVFLFSLFL